MTDADALLRAIVRHPDDDTPRLVYADWLQENGRPEEAEFLRVQCRLAAGGADDPEYPDLLAREEELSLWLGTHVPGPRPTFPGGLSVDGGSWWWSYPERGFPRFLEFDGTGRHGTRAMRALAAGLERAFDALPTRWLVLGDITAAQLAALLKQPVLAKVTQLTVMLVADGDEVARLLSKSRHLRNLKGLALGFAPGDAGCEALAAGPWDGLDWFSPACHQFTPAGVRALGAAGWFRNLRALTLDDLPDAAALEMLGRLGPFPRLHALDLTQSLYSEATWRAFAASKAFPALQKLTLERSDLSRGEFAALAGAGGFALRALNLQACGLLPEAGAALAAAPWAGSLRTLDLSYNMLPAADLKDVVGCRRFAELRHLNVGMNMLAPPVLSALSANPALRRLQVLGLSGGEASSRALTPTAFDRFLAKLNMPELRHLDLSGQPVGARAARRLAEAKFGTLTRLGLRACRVTDPAVAALLAAPSLANLIQLELDDNGLSGSPERLTDRSVLPRLAACTLTGNSIPSPLARRLRRRPGVSV
jgi:uncharacterized protein (TIGR02996 family)